MVDRIQILASAFVLRTWQYTRRVSPMRFHGRVGLIHVLNMPCVQHTGGSHLVLAVQPPDVERNTVRLSFTTSDRPFQICSAQPTPSSILSKLPSARPPRDSTWQAIVSSIYNSRLSKAIDRAKRILAQRNAPRTGLHIVIVGDRSLAAAWSPRSLARLAVSLSAARAHRVMRICSLVSRLDIDRCCLGYGYHTASSCISCVS